MRHARVAPHGPRAALPPARRGCSGSARQMSPNARERRTASRSRGSPQPPGDRSQCSKARLAVACKLNAQPDSCEDAHCPQAECGSWGAATQQREAAPCGSLPTEPLVPRRLSPAPAVAGDGRAAGARCAGSAAPGRERSAHRSRPWHTTTRSAVPGARGTPACRWDRAQSRA